VTKLRYEFQQDSLDIQQVTKDALCALHILPHLTQDAHVVKLSLELIQDLNSKFSL
tara:strand:- start:1 stop:168 length:168 start_codon:yes stop_codon:yes gene_type:complete